MYRAYGLLQPHTDYTSAEAERRLAARFPGYDVARDGDRVTVSKGDWSMDLWVNDGPEVLSESAGLAEKIAGLADGADLEACGRRVEVGSDTPDPFLEHFAEYQQVVEVLQSFRGLIAVDPKEPALL